MEHKAFLVLPDLLDLFSGCARQLVTPLQLGEHIISKKYDQAEANAAQYETPKKAGQHPPPKVSRTYNI